MAFDITQRSRAPGDILVSGHPKLQTFLPEIVRYVSTIKGLCCLGPAPIKTNIGFRTVNRTGRLLDDFKFKTYSETVVKKVMTSSLAEPTFFNTALLKSLWEKFQTQSGLSVKVSHSLTRTRPVLTLLVRKIATISALSEDVISTVTSTSVILRQVVVIFSDGLDEDVMLLERESERLRQSGKTDRASVCFHYRSVDILKGFGSVSPTFLFGVNHVS